MRILHTADWHIGKMLHKHSLHDDMQLFLSWLLVQIEVQKIDLLLVSGDIFDVANPAVKDRETYYKFLSQLIGSGIQVIITGGNHDSVGLLDAPVEILRHINISVIGGAKENLQDEIVEVKNEDGEIELVVAAVPFLRDKDLRNLVSDEKFESRSDALKAGIRSHYKTLGKICVDNYDSIPAIAMGHLYARGASTSDSERDIHIGNAAAVESDVFPDSFDYVALGHIHRPQVIAGNEMIRYSGSPIALSFSEKNDHKSVLVLDLKDGQLSQPTTIDVPKNRDLMKFSGPFDEVKSKLENYNPNFKLVSLVEIEVLEEDFSSVVLANVDSLVNEYSGNNKVKILKSRTQFKNGSKDTSDLFQEGANIEDLKPKEVFAKRIESENLAADKLVQLQETFLELLEEIEGGG